MSVITSINLGEIYEWYVGDMKWYMEIIDNHTFYTANSLEELKAYKHCEYIYNLLEAMNKIDDMKLVIITPKNKQSRFEMLLKGENNL